MAKVLEVRDGAEISVETGIGFIDKVEEPKGRNAQVVIRADHLQIPVSSWVDTAATDLYQTVRAACAEGRRIEYRVVVRRKGDVDPTLPLKDLANMQKIRDLEWVDYAGGIVASDSPAPPPPASKPAVQTPQDDPPAPTVHPDPSPAPQPSQGPASGRTCGLCGQPVAGGPPVRTVGGILQHVECPGTPTADTPPPGPLPSDPPRGEPASPGPGPKMAEGRPWEFTNSDGTLNPGSYAYSAAEGIVLLANDLLLDRARHLEGPFSAPNEPQLRGLARRLIRAADTCQANLRDDGHVARMAASHTRCRAALRAALDVYPPPWGAPADDIDAWEAQLVEHAGIILRLTVELVDPGPAQ